MALKPETRVAGSLVWRQPFSAPAAIYARAWAHEISGMTARRLKRGREHWREVVSCTCCMANEVSFNYKGSACRPWRRTSGVVVARRRAACASVAPRERRPSAQQRWLAESLSKC